MHDEDAVQKPLVSAGRTCDAGHKVVFNKYGRFIQHETTGQQTNFLRVDSVYRLKVGLAGTPCRYSLGRRGGLRDR